jgi:ribosomal protein L11 methylase PrmA
LIRSFAVRGAEGPLAAALDRIHVHCAVQGIVEHADGFDAFVDGPLPELGDLAVSTVELPVETGTWTGLEADRPILVAEDLLVRPPWVERPADFAGIELVVPRAMAFGSGEHGSTQAALCLLRTLLETSEPPAATCVDVGTGSGILALCAQRLGVRRILACDVEAESVEAARALLPAADVRLGGPEVFDAAVGDLVIANLDARQLTAALGGILGLWSRRGPLLLSGMRPDEVARIAERVPAAELLRVERQGFVAVGFAGP